MFKVDCPGCKAPYQVDERRVPATGLNMRCPKCGTAFKVEPPGEGGGRAAAEPGPSPLAGPAAAPEPKAPRIAKPTMVGIAPAAPLAASRGLGGLPTSPRLPLPRPGGGLPRPGAKVTSLGVAPPGRGGATGPAPERGAPGGEMADADLPAVVGSVAGAPLLRGSPGPEQPPIPPRATAGADAEPESDLPAVVAGPRPRGPGLPAPPPVPRRRPKEAVPELAEVDLSTAARRPQAPDEAELQLPSLAGSTAPRLVGSGKATAPLGSVPGAAAARGGGLGSGGGAPGGGAPEADADLPVAVGPRGGAAAAWGASVPGGGLDLPPEPLSDSAASELDFDLGGGPGRDLPPLSFPAADGGDFELPALPQLDPIDLPSLAAGTVSGSPALGADPPAGESSDADLPAIGLAAGIAGLPALTGELDLPDFAGTGAAAASGREDVRASGAEATAAYGQIELPALAEADLPALGGGGDLPALGMPQDLPSLGRTDLPALGMQPGLPALGGAGLPAAGGAGLPSPADSLPSPASILPSPAESLPSPAESLPSPAESLPSPSREFGAGFDEELDLGQTGGFDAAEADLAGGFGESPPAPVGEAKAMFGEGFGVAGFGAGPTITEAASGLDPFAASVPAPPPSAAPPAAEGEVAVVRQVDGGTGYGEVNLGDFEGSEGPIEAGLASEGDDDGPDDMEFGGIPQEDAKPGAEAAPVHARMAIGAKIAPTGTEERKPRRWFRYVAAALVVGVGGGGALSLTSHGPFGWYFLEGVLRGSEHEQLLASSIASARAALGVDTYPEARRALRESERARDAAPRVPGIAAYATFVAALYELRFGADAEVNARSRVTMEELTKLTEVPHLGLARAGHEAVTGQLARSATALERLMASHPRDIDVLVLRGEVSLLGNKPEDSVAAWQAAAEIEPSARTAFGLARAAYASGEAENAETHARRALSLSADHVGARILLARVAWTRNEDEAVAVRLLEEATQNPEAASPPEQVQLNTLMGDIHLARSRVSQAEAAFGRALKLDPKAAGALRGLGEALYQAGRYAEALARFEAGTKADPNLLLAQIGVAKTLLALERLDDARPMLVKLDEKHKQSMDVAYWYGVMLDAVGRREEGEAAFRRAIENGGRDPRVVNAYTRLALSLGGRGENTAARQLLDEALQKLPASPALHKAFGELALQQGAHAEALTQFEKARALAPHDMGVLFAIGVTQRHQRDFDAALATFDEVAESDRDFPGLALERGLVFESAGRAEEALKAYEAALAKAPDDVDLKLRVGCGKAAAGRGADAEQLLREVLAARPASAETNHCLGRAILGKGTEIEIALRHLERATDLDPHRAEYHLYVGLAALESGRIAQAQTALKRALEIDQSLADAYWQRGVLRYRQGQVKDAVVDLERALELRPSRYEAHAALAEAYLDLMQEERALVEWSRAIAADPENALWRYRYGKILVARGQSDAAQPQLVKAVELAERMKPSPAWLWEAHMLLARSLGGNAQAIPHWQAYLRSCPQDHPYKDEGKAVLRRLGVPWDGG